MTEGWNIIAPLEKLDFGAPIPANLVREVCAALTAFNTGIKNSAIELLKAQNKGKVASRLGGEWAASLDHFFGDYFSTEAWCPGPGNPPS